MNNQELLQQYDELYFRMLGQNNLKGAQECLDKIAELRKIPENSHRENDNRGQLNG